MHFVCASGSKLSQPMDFRSDILYVGRIGCKQVSEGFFSCVEGKKNW